jgi:hypothetical protein
LESLLMKAALESLFIEAIPYFIEASHILLMAAD